MRSSLAFGIVSILVAAVPCVAVESPGVAEGLCLLQTKAAKHGRSHHTHDTALRDSDVSVSAEVSGASPDDETATKGKAALLETNAMPSSSSSGAESAHAEESEDSKLQGITDLEAYGGSMMDLVLGGWRHSHENPAKKVSPASSTQLVNEASVVPKPSNNPKEVVDAFGDPIRDMDVDLLSTAPARVRVEPILEDTPQVELADNGPSEEQADKVLAEAQKSLEAYSSVLSETEKISLLGQTADESESKPQQTHSRQQASSATHSHQQALTSVRHVVDHKVSHTAVQQKVAATTEHDTSETHSIAQKTDSTLPDDSAYDKDKDKIAAASVSSAKHQPTPQHPRAKKHATGQ